MTSSPLSTAWRWISSATCALLSGRFSISIATAPPPQSGRLSVRIFGMEEAPGIDFPITSAARFS